MVCSVPGLKVGCAHSSTCQLIGVSNSVHIVDPSCLSVQLEPALDSHAVFVTLFSTPIVLLWRVVYCFTFLMPSVFCSLRKEPRERGDLAVLLVSGYWLLRALECTCETVH